MFSNRKQIEKSVKLLDMDKHNNINNLSVFKITQLLRTCTEIGDLQRGVVIYNLLSPELKRDSKIILSLINLQLKCGNVENVQSIFDLTPTKTLHMYGAMMKGYIKNQTPNKAIDLFSQIKTPDDVIFILLFNACSHSGTPQALEILRKISKEVPTRFYSNPRLIASLVDGLMKCGDIQHAEYVFHSSNNKTSDICGAMMKGYIHNKLPRNAINIFNQMENRDDIAFLLLFNACAQLGTIEALEILKRTLKDVPTSFYSNPRLRTSLVDGLMKCHDVEQAESIFDFEKNKTSELYAAMMKGYVENQMPNKVLELFNQIDNPTNIIISLVCNACAQLATTEALTLLKHISQEIPHSFYSNPWVVTSLIDGLMKCGDVERAEKIFYSSKIKEVHIYGAMMKGYIKNEQPEKAINLFKEIRAPDHVIITLLFNSYAKIGNSSNLDAVKKLWEKLPKSIRSQDRVQNTFLDLLIKCDDLCNAKLLFSNMKRSPVNCAILMSGFLKENQHDEILHLINQMKIERIELTIPIYLNVIKALSQISDFSLSQSIAKEIPDSFHRDNRIQNALIDMWGKTGQINEAIQIFQRITNPNVFTYSSMVNAFGLNGLGTQAVELFNLTPVEFIDETSYICVLNACSHSGLVDQARSIFRNIKNKTALIYTTMIDCLSRATLFEEAQTLIDEFESCHSPEFSMYMALLSGARNENNVHISKRIYDRMKELFPDSNDRLTSAAVLLANVYGSTGNIGEASNIRMEIHKSNTKKKIGLSWTVVDGQMFKFRAHDQSHPRSVEIYAECEKISKEIVEHGHIYDSSWITRSLSQDETVTSVLCGHSERLAIAWNFVVNPKAKRIQITKNLRVCGDCHRATKLIAAIRNCEIIVRDANRIHHFYSNGQCSCNDYF